MTREEIKANNLTRAKRYAAAVEGMTAAAAAFENATLTFAAAVSCGPVSDVCKVRRSIIGTVYKCVANVRCVPVRCVSICVDPPF